MSKRPRGALSAPSLYAGQPMTSKRRTCSTETSTWVESGKSGTVENKERYPTRDSGPDPADTPEGSAEGALLFTPNSEDAARVDPSRWNPAVRSPLCDKDVRPRCHLRTLSGRREPASLQPTRPPSGIRSRMWN